ncbi:hypothetical protein [Alistipes putredinis]
MKDIKIGDPVRVDPFYFAIILNEWVGMDSPFSLRGSASLF